MRIENTSASDSQCKTGELKYYTGPKRIKTEMIPSMLCTTELYETASVKSETKSNASDGEEYFEVLEIVDSDDSSQDDSQKCYICNAISESYQRNLYETKSQHTETRICDFITKWLSDKPTNHRIESTKINSSDENCICTDCFEKINEYDLACVTAERIDKELRETFLLTESLLTEIVEPEPEKVEKMLDPHTGEFVELFTPSEKEIPVNNVATTKKRQNLVEIDDSTAFKKIEYVYYCTICKKKLFR